ncbi:hypothetical protein D4R99_04700 [bacterium]|nr:MAG: hypothetical protein D4R99_04700 [bacterium]
MTIFEKEFRKNLEKEFEQLYNLSPRKLPTDIDAVVVLSHEDYNFPENDIRRRETKELFSRCEYSVELLKNTSAEILLVLNGLRVQLPLMEKYVRDSGVKKEQIRLLDCGEIGKSNTKLQFEVFLEDPFLRKMKKVVFITNRYHVPRATRTASKFLPENMIFYVFGVPGDTHLYDKQKNIAEEIKRIIKYSQTGDISFLPRQIN